MKEKELNISDIEIEEPRRTVVHTVQQKPKKDNVFKRLAKNKTFLIGIVVLIVGIGAIVTVFYSVFAYQPAKTDGIIDFDTSALRVSVVEASEFQKIPINEPSEPRTRMNPINGMLLTRSEFEKLSTRNPVAVMMNNHVAARPQSGLHEADVVYEAIAESGITRYMPVYWSNAISKVGPIRSVRQYYLEWLSEYDAILINDGYAYSDDPRVDAAGNIWRYGIKSISTQGAWRDSSRVAPHNEYSSVANAFELGENNEWTGLPTSFKSWEFSPDAPVDERGDIQSVTVTNHVRLSNAGLYDAKWEYDPDTNVFLRSTGGLPDLDLETGHPVEAKNVILQEVTFYPTGDAKAHNILETIGEGKVTYLIDGKAIDGTWKKASRTERTMFFDSKGDPMKFNRGLIWITALSTTDGQFDIIEQ